MRVRGSSAFQFRCVACVAALVLFAAPASAGGPSRADVLFQEGRAAAVAGDYVTARAKFVESQRLDPAVGTLLNIADCEEHLVHPAAALSVFRFALPQLDPNDDRHAITKARIEALEKRAPRLTVTLAPGAPSTTAVKRDGVQLDSRDLGVPAVVEPGPHVVSFQAPGGREETTPVTLREGQSETLVLDPVRAATTPSPGVEDAHDGWLDGASRARVGIGALGIGAAGVVLVGVSWAAMSSHASTIERACDPATKVCSGAGTNEALDAQDAGRTWRVLNYVGWGVGLAGLGAGTYLLLTGAPKPRAVTFDMAPVLGGVHVGARARF